MEKTHEAEMEIDLIEIFYALKKRILLLAAALLMGAVIAGGYTKLMITPIYSATSTILVLSKETTLTSLADLQLGSQLSQDYAVLFKSRTVMKQVISDMGLDMPYQQLENSISITYPENTRIMEITVTNADPELAKTLADKVAQVGSQYVEDKMEIPGPKIIEEAEVPGAAVSPNFEKNIFLGGLAGLALAAGIVVLISVLDDTIKTEEDIQKYLNMSTLASIPDRKDFITGRSRKKTSKRKHRRRKRK